MIIIYFYSLFFWIVAISFLRNFFKIDEKNKYFLFILTNILI